MSASYIPGLSSGAAIASGEFLSMWEGVAAADLIFQDLEAIADAPIDAELMAVMEAVAANLQLDLRKAAPENRRVVEGLAEREPLGRPALKEDVEAHVQPSDVFAAEIIATGEDPPMRYLMEGARPHEIEPLHAAVLHWLDDEGMDVFRQFVPHHPGMAPNPFWVIPGAVAATELELAVAEILARRIAYAIP